MNFQKVLKKLKIYVYSFLRFIVFTFIAFYRSFYIVFLEEPVVFILHVLPMPKKPLQRKTLSKLPF